MSIPSAFFFFYLFFFQLPETSCFPWSVGPSIVKASNNLLRLFHISGSDSSTSLVLHLRTSEDSTGPIRIIRIISHPEVS